MNIVVFASGRGSNFKAIVENIETGILRHVKVSLLLSDKPAAQALVYAKEKGIASKCVDPKTFENKELYEDALLEAVKKVPCDLIVLAGYMKVLGEAFLNHVGCPVVNIHPSLLPSFTGLHAQRQAVEYGVKVSGCTVHFVDHLLDHGPIIAQVSVPVMEDDDEESLSARILVQEHILYSKCLQQLADQTLVIEDRRVKNKSE